MKFQQASALSSPLTLPPLFQPPAPPPSMSTSKRGSSNTRSSATVCSLHASVMLSAIPHSNPLTSLKMCNKSSTSNCIKCVRYCQLGRSILSYSKHPHTALTLTELVAIVCVVHTIFHISVLYTLPYSLYITVSAIHNGTMSLTLFIPHPSHSFTVIRLPYYYKKAKDKPGWPQPTFGSPRRRSLLRDLAMHILRGLLFMHVDTVYFCLCFAYGVCK